MIYALVYGIMLLTFIPFNYVGVCNTDEYLNKDTTDWMRGVAILIIVIHHAVQQNGEFPFLYPFSVLGYGGVAVFLLLSGYGLGTQYKVKDSYLTGSWLINKILRLYITFWIAYAFMYVGSCISQTPIETGMIIQNLLTMSIADTATWYIKIQAVLYVLFYLIFRLLKVDNNHKLVVLYLICGVYCVLGAYCGIQRYWYFTVLWFPVGLTMAWHKDFLISMLKKVGILAFGLAFLIGLCGLIIFRFFMGNLGYPAVMDFIITVSLVICFLCLCYKFQFKSKIIRLIGSASLELYLVHSMMLTGYLGQWTFDSCLQFIGFLLSSIILALVIKYIAGKITRMVPKY